MAWVVKNKRGEYWAGDAWGPKSFAYALPDKREVYSYIGNHFFGQTIEDQGLRIVRLKPRAKLDEAQIRRDERLRIAGAFGERGILVLFNNSAVAEASGLSRTEIGAKVIQRAILAYEWKP